LIATLGISIHIHGHFVRNICSTHCTHDKIIIHDVSCGIVAIDDCDLRDTIYPPSQYACLPIKGGYGIRPYARTLNFES